MSEKRIGDYTVSLDDQGNLHIATASLGLHFPAAQARELGAWLYEQQGGKSSLEPTSQASTVQTETTITEPAPDENPAEAVQRIIDEAIEEARNRYPASLTVENRDRFLDQMTRDRRIKPYLSQGTVTHKQVILWVEQKLDTGKAWSEEAVPEKKKRWSLF